ncbi:hypothetical protein CAJAP_07688 [Camponotus japonicus]
MEREKQWKGGAGVKSPSVRYFGGDSEQELSRNKLYRNGGRRRQRSAAKPRRFERRELSDPASFLTDRLIVVLDRFVSS